MEPMKRNVLASGRCMDLDGNGYEAKRQHPAGGWSSHGLSLTEEKRPRNGVSFELIDQKAKRRELVSYLCATRISKGSPAIFPGELVHAAVQIFKRHLASVSDGMALLIPLSDAFNTCRLPSLSRSTSRQSLVLNRPGVAVAAQLFDGKMPRYRKQSTNITLPSMFDNEIAFGRRFFVRADMPQNPELIPNDFLLSSRRGQRPDGGPVRKTTTTHQWVVSEQTHDRILLTSGVV